MAAPPGLFIPLALTCWIACGDAGTEPDAGAQPDTLLASSCPDDPIEAGADCALEPSVRCFEGGNDCGLAQVCSCVAGLYACTAPDFGAACGDIENAHCAIEGVHGCYMNPTSGSRWCEEGEWQVEYSCPAGCPGPDDSEPESGDSCSVAVDEVCVYQSTECHCVDSEFRCCDYAPCP